jgi:hypothetical protein
MAMGMFPRLEAYFHFKQSCDIVQFVLQQEEDIWFAFARCERSERVVDAM